MNAVLNVRSKMGNLNVNSFNNRSQFYRFNTHKKSFTFKLVKSN